MHSLAKDLSNRFPSRPASRQRHTKHSHRLCSSHVARSGLCMESVLLVRQGEGRARIHRPHGVARRRLRP